MRKIFTNIMWIPSFSFSLVILSVTFLLYFVNVSGANNKNWMLKKSSSPDDYLRDSSISLNLDLYNYSHSSNINGNVDRSRPRSHHLRRSNNNNGGSGSGGGGGRKHKNNNKNNGHKSQDIPHRHQRRGGGGRGQRQRMNKNALRLLSGISDNIEGGGAFPPLFNIAPRAIITVNATCGLNGREEYCKLVDAQPHNSWATQCGICDGQSLEMEKQHPIESVLDSLDNWWQSPTLQYGKGFEYITIQFDLKQAFQIFSIMIKSAISPRPASWILEKSLDNITYIPWQYFGTSDLDCRRRYNLPGQTGKYSFESDDEVICTTQFSKAMPLENGEIHVSLMKNRPGAMEQSQQLMDFITARFIRIRFQGMHSTANSDNSVSWILDSAAMEKRSFYSIKLIRISGRLACNGHASRTLEMVNESGESELICDCQHNTCGSDCHECCSLFNQVPFNPGTYKTENICEECQCNRHSYSCIYDEYISKEKLSTNIYGIRQGGGVCLNCTNFTEGFNCEKCQKGYFRPSGVYPYDEMPCQRCDCDPFRSTGDCDSESGKCFCKEGFHGHNCMECSDGYKGDACTKCTCDKRGTLPGGQCEDQCQCKFHVEGHDCSECTPGYFSLRQENPEGCLKCFCSGVGLSCKSSKIRISSYETLESWAVTDITKSVIAYPVRDNETGYMVFGMYELSEVEAVYWLAPAIYEGNHLTSYGSKFVFEITWIVVRGDTSGKPNPGPNLILIGKNGMKIAYGDEIFEGSRAVIDVLLTEDGWYHIPKSVKDIITRSRRTEYKGDPVTRNQFMSVLNDIESVLIRGTFHTDQAESILEKATLYSGGRDVSETEMSLVEECVCPPGYTGLSCESCAFGYIRTYENSTTHELIGKCLPCACNGHAETCELETGVCGECQHNTFGERCERCKVGYYGNAMHGTSQDCNRCACPLLEDDNNFSPSCQLKKLSLDLNLDSIHLLDYVCTQCPNGFTGDHCEICDDGFWGDPLILGSKCLPCLCHGGPCDPETGQCITCLGNTEGWKCERCKSGFWGDPELGCEACECYDDGSITSICDSETGQCSCKNHFTGLKCDECDIGYADPDLECAPCDCNRNGSLTDSFCDPFSGKCVCKTGVVGLKCDECQEDYFGLKDDGCEGEYIKFD